MESPICGVCLDKEGPLKLTKKVFTKEISNILQKCCDFLFQNGDCLVDNICNNCLKSIKKFEEFCDSIRNVHGFTQVYVENAKDEVMDEPIEYVEEELVENTADIPTEFPIKSTLSIEKDIETNSALARRPVAMTVKVIQALEKQLEFEVIRISFDDLEFGKVSRFVNTDCKQCGTKFQTFDEIHAHYLEKHKCPATWMCCNIELESPYDIYDHVKYHERIEDFRCAACFKCFLTSNKLKFHIRRNHLPIENDNYTCLIKSCKKDCKNQRLLLNHQKSHISVECPYCTDMISALNYMTHVRGHTGTVNAKQRSSNEKGRTNRKPKHSSDSKLKKVIGGKCVKPKVTQKKEPKESTTLSKKTLTLSFEQNDESGLVYCDICNMTFNQMSRVLIHRNKVHV